jgi:hypothetical protein
MHLTAESYTRTLEKVIDTVELNKNVIFMHGQRRLSTQQSNTKQDIRDYMSGIISDIQNEDVKSMYIEKIKEKDQNILRLSEIIEQLVEKNKILNKNQEVLKKKIKQLEHDIEVMQI